MCYFVTSEGVSPSVRKKRAKRLGLLLQQGMSVANGGKDREKFPPPVADQDGYSAILSVGEKTNRVGTVRRFVSLAGRGGTRGGHQFPRARKFVVAVPVHTDFFFDCTDTNYTCLVKNYRSTLATPVMSCRRYDTRLTAISRRAYTLRFCLEKSV